MQTSHYLSSLLFLIISSLVFSFLVAKGELDFFPLAMYRLLSRTYSVMSVRNKICLEMVATLDSLVASGESISSTYGLSDPAGNKIIKI